MTALLDTSKVIVGASGSGKTVTAKAEVQQLLDQRRHLVVIDPTGVWWGMRSNAAGDGPGFDLPIFGGEHGDVPIRPDQGAAIARIIVEQRVSAIVDLSAIDNSRDWRVFMRDFVAELRRKPRGNFHFVLDEADEFAAERVADDVGFSLREDLVWVAKRGRSAGFVPTFITQRTAEIAKAVISQAQTIVAHQLIAPTDRKAIDDYLKGHGTAEARAEVMGSLAELAVGERWVYSPRLKVLERGVTPALATFDSSRTPAPGEAIAQPRNLAELDLSAIRAALAGPRQPESQNSGYPDDTIPTEPAEAYAKGGVVGTMLRERDERITELTAEVERLTGEVAELDLQGDRYEAALGRIEAVIREVREGRPLQPVERTSSTDLDLRTATEAAEHATDPDVAAFAQAAKSKRGASIHFGGLPPATPADASDTALRRGRRALVPLAEIYPAALSEAQWATLAGLAKTGGTWSTYRGALRQAGYVRQDQAGLWQATKDGCAAAGVTPAKLPPIGPDRARFWGDKIPSVRRMVDVLVKRWPHYTTREALASDLGMAASGGTFSTYLGRLRTNALLDEQKSRVRLAAEIMGTAR